MDININVHHYIHTVDEKAIETKLDTVLATFEKLTSLTNQLDTSTNELKEAVNKNTQQ